VVFDFELSFETIYVTASFFSFSIGERKKKRE